MRFTFGIVSGDDSPFLPLMVESIAAQAIPDCEIIVVGNPQGFEDPRVRLIPFVEERPKWITRKKNIITQHATHENIVFLHDYIALEPGWYEGWLRFGDDFKVAMNRITNIDGTRYRDWLLWVHDVEDALRQVGAGERNCILPYGEADLTAFQYVSGAYWVAKRSVMREFPLEERLVWGEAEDVVWSGQVRVKYKLSMNAFSEVRIMKTGKDLCFGFLSEEMVAKIKPILLNGPRRTTPACIEYFLGLLS